MPIGTRGHVIEELTAAYIASLDLSNPPAIEDICSELVQQTNEAIELANAPMPKSWTKWRTISDPTIQQVEMLVQTFHNVRMIHCGGLNSDKDTDILAVYMTDGDQKGLYSSSDSDFRNIFKRYNPTLNSNDIRDIINDLKAVVPHVERCNDPNLIAVNNGIFNYKTKTLEPFSPDRVFLSKSKVNYHPNPVNPIIHNTDDNTDWDVESWMQELSDDPEIIQVLWEILGAIIRPNVPWNKSAWFYSTVGNNGKGTLCTLMRNLCGNNSWASISLSDFSKDFMLEPLTRSTAIIVDENDVGGFIDRAANLKAVITGDAIQINRKFKEPISYQFHGFMVQCINEFPRIRDKSESFYRRQLFVPFEKCFTGIERTYIKSDYLYRTEVLEYVLWKVLTMPDYYSLSEPESCKGALDEYKESNDPVRQFCIEMLPQCKWDLLPFSFMYDLYQVWYKKNQTGTMQGRNGFIRDFYNLINDGIFPDWRAAGSSRKNIRPKHLMDAYEPLIITYDLKSWQNVSYTGGNPQTKAKFTLNPFYTGILRNTNMTGTTNVDEDEDGGDSNG